MHNSEQRGWSGINFAVKLTILALTAVLLLALQQTGRLGTIEGLVTLVTAPGQSGLATMTNRLSRSITTLRNYRNLQQRATELEQITQSLIVENLRLKEVERENQRLRELLAFSETSSVTNKTAKVLLMTDTSSTINAILQASRLTGTINGAPGSHPVMGFIPQGTEIGVGEVVLTSGMGGNFPKGIPIGQVVEVRQKDVNVFQEAVVRPTVNFGRLEFVMVSTNFDPIESVPQLDTLPTPSAPAENPPDAEGQ